MMGDFKNLFSWSKSRDNIFQFCKRKYYFRYYGYWGGWDKDSPAREIYILKNLVNRNIWIGQVVHELIKNLLLLYKVNMNISLSNLLNRLHKKINQEFILSKAKTYRQFPKRFGLIEHEYDLLITKEEWKEFFDLAERCLENFFNSDILQNIKKKDKTDWIFLEDFLSYNYENTKIFLQMDFAMKEGKQIRIFDWKTGQERVDKKINLQLSSYAFYVLQKWEINPENIKVELFNVNLDKSDSFIVTNEIIDTITKYIQTSIFDMKSLLTDKNNNLADIKNFPLTENPKKCNTCNFKRLCGR